MGNGVALFELSFNRRRVIYPPIRELFDHTDLASRRFIAANNCSSTQYLQQLSWQHQHQTSEQYIHIEVTETDRNPGDLGYSRSSHRLLF